MRRPLPDYDVFGFTYDQDLSCEDHRMSPIFGPSGRQLRIYRLRGKPKPYVGIMGTLTPLDNLLPATTGEEWRANPDMGIEVSNCGRVRRLNAHRRPRLLKQKSTGLGLCVLLDGKQVPVASLVAELFGEPRSAV